MDQGRSWWQLLKTVLALAHSGAVAWLVLTDFFERLTPPPPGWNLRGFALAIGLTGLGLPWSISIYFLFPDGSAMGAWAMKHRWVPMAGLFATVALNSALLWWWARRPAKRTHRDTGVHVK